MRNLHEAMTVVLVVALITLMATPAEELAGIKATDLVPIVKKMNPKTQIVAISSEGRLNQPDDSAGQGFSTRP